MQAELAQLRVVVDVDERRQRCRHDTVDKLAVRRDRHHAVIRRARDVGRASGIDEHDLAIARGRARGAEAVAGIAAEQEEMRLVESQELALRSNDRLAVRALENRQGHDVFAHEPRQIDVRNVVIENAGIASPVR